MSDRNPADCPSDEQERHQAKAPTYDASMDDYAGISTVAETTDDLQAAKDFAEMIVDTVREGLLVLDLDLRVKAANESFYHLFETRPEETVDRLVYEIGDGQWDIPQLRQLLEDVLPESKVFNDYEVTADFDRIGERTMLLNARQMNAHQLILLAIEDVTERRRSARELAASQERLQLLVENATEYAIFTMDRDGRIRTWNAGAERILGWSREEAIGAPGSMIFTPEQCAAGVPQQEMQVAREEGTGNDERWHQRKDGSRFWGSGVMVALRDGELHGFAKILRDNTERKEAEEELQRREERYRLALKNSPVVFARMDEELRYEWIFNPHTDFDASAARGLRDDEVDEGPGVDAMMALKRRVLESGQQERQEITFERADGSHTHDVTVTPIKDEQGCTRKLMSASLDVTGRKRAEADLERERARLETVLEALPTGIVIADAEGRLIRDNAAARELWGVPLSADSWEDYGAFVGWWPETGERIEADEWAMTRAVLHGEETRDELILCQPFGSDERRYYLNNVVPLRDADGTITGGVAAMLDVTERLAMQEALRESEERFRKAMEIETVGVIFWSSDIEIVEVNDAFLQITGFDREEVIGTSWRELTPEPHHTASERAVAQLEERGVNEPYQKEYYRKDGSRWWGLFAARQLGEDEVVEFVLDITKQKETEQTLQELTETLEAKVTERTRQVRELASTLTRAEQEERRRISQILHDDLQQQLYGLGMKMTLLRKDAETGAIDELLRQLAEAEEWIEQSVEITRNLTVDLSPPILKSEGLTDTIQWLQAQMKELHDLDVEIRAGSRLRTPEDDMRVLLFQIVRELLFNVAKHAGVGEATVELQAVDHHVEIVVSDEGAGFDVEAAESRGEGGFGLFSVRERLGLFGDDMQIDSARGKGTRVKVSVPLHME